MTLFLTGLVVLLVGYLVGSRLVESIVGPDDRETPAVRFHDGVDYVVMPKWKNMLIQLLNIAGIGPVIGVISGIVFGDIVFLIIPIGCVLMGAVHDYMSGMMSLRNNGCSVSALVSQYLGKRTGHIFNVFMQVILLLVVAVFINVPAQLTTKMLPIPHCFIIALIVIFAYYIIATMFPIDKIIGRVYPIFGFILLLGTVGLFVMILLKSQGNPALLIPSEGFKENMFTMAKGKPVFPLLFVTIACGILSGFHATQSPLVARTMKSEREAIHTFHAMMIVEGFIAMVWAAGAMAIYNRTPELMLQNPNHVLIVITNFFFGSKWTSGIVVASVIILAITSGDTALRSARLALAESIHFEQRTLWRRIAACLPLILVVILLLIWSNGSAASFKLLWNYFAWGNQIIAAFVLMAATSYLIQEKKNYIITLLPACFITSVVICYILWISPAHGGPMGLGLNYNYARILALAITLMICECVYRNACDARTKKIVPPQNETKK